MKIDKEKLILFAAYFINYAVIITAITLLMDWCFWEIRTWIYYFFQGLFLGLGMAAWSTWEHMKKDQK